MGQVLPALRVQDAFMVAEEVVAQLVPGRERKAASKLVRQAVAAALDAVEADSMRWGHACTICKGYCPLKLMRNGDRMPCCPKHGVQQTTMLLIGWMPRGTK